MRRLIRNVPIKFEKKKQEKKHEKKTPNTRPTDMGKKLLQRAMG